MPFRLLAIVPDLEHLEEIDGRALRSYAAKGVGVTIACASGADPGIGSHRALLGIQALILLDHGPGERNSPSLTSLLADILRAVRPHVVLLGSDPIMIKVGRSAFEAVRPSCASAASLPAKLYRVAAPGSAETSTRISIADGSSATQASFQRLFPSPWITGVVEKDLFAGLPADPDPAAGALQRRIAG